MTQVSSPSRILIFGGTFDPPHRAHIELPQAAARELKCDRIIYIPAAINPLKAAPGTPPPTPANHRLAMLRLALADVPTVEISTIELDRSEDRPSYTIDTLREVVGWAQPTATSTGASSRRRSNDDSAVGDAHPTLFLLIGADQSLDFHRWKDWREILKLATPAVMLRPPWTQATYAKALRQRYDADETRQWEERTLKRLPMIDVSATEIRRRIADGESTDGLVDPRVAAYVREHGLYRER